MSYVVCYFSMCVSFIYIYMCIIWIHVYIFPQGKAAKTTSLVTDSVENWDKVQCTPGIALLPTRCFYAVIFSALGNNSYHCTLLSNNFCLYSTFIFTIYTHIYVLYIYIYTYRWKSNVDTKNLFLLFFIYSSLAFAHCSIYFHFC